MKDEILTIFMEKAVDEFKKKRKSSASRVCNAALKKVSQFSEKEMMPFSELTNIWLMDFEGFLRKSLADNTVSTYLRMLQAVYNKAVQEGVAIHTQYLFKGVFKGRVPSISRALLQEDFLTLVDCDEEQLLSLMDCNEEQPPTAAATDCNEELAEQLLTVRDLFVLMFLLRGIPFVDLAYMRHCDIKGDRIIYRRHKTGKLLTVYLEPQALQIIERYCTGKDQSSYLFPFLTLEDGGEYAQYERALRRFNVLLHQLGAMLGLHIPLTSYCARHTWATFANHCCPDKKLVSEGMGHSSVLVTEIYFKTYEIDKMTKMNQGVIDYAFAGSKKHLKAS